jgi:hypothetical protein
MRSSTKPSVRQAAISIGQAIVIQFMFGQRRVWMRSEVTCQLSDSMI